MKPIENWDEVKDFSEVTKFPIGPQKCQIIKVTNDEEKKYLRFEFDVVEGEFTGYFKTLSDNNDDNAWPTIGTMIRSYKDTALSFFKGSITAIEKTNKGYNFVATNWDEKTLEKKYVVVNFREEEYESDGVVKTRVRPFEFRSAEALRNGEIDLQPAKKLLKKKEETPVAPVTIDETKLPF